EQGLLDAFAADVAAAGAGAGAAGAAGDLVDLVDEDDAVLGGVDGVAALEEQLRDHHLHVLPVVAGFSIFSGVDDDERHLEEVGELAGDVRLARARRTHQQHVRLAQERLLAQTPLLDALEVLVRRGGDGPLGGRLPDHEAVEVIEDLPGCEDTDVLARRWRAPRSAGPRIGARAIVLLHEGSLLQAGTRLYVRPTPGRSSLAGPAVP